VENNNSAVARHAEINPVMDDPEMELAQGLMRKLSGIRSIAVGAGGKGQRHDDQPRRNGMRSVESSDRLCSDRLLLGHDGQSVSVAQVAAGRHYRPFNTSPQKS
jgi:hypothetical protein